MFVRPRHGLEAIKSLVRGTLHPVSTSAADALVSELSPWTRRAFRTTPWAVRLSSARAWDSYSLDQPHPTMLRTKLLIQAARVIARRPEELVEKEGFEPPTRCLQSSRSTPELLSRTGAWDRTRVNGSTTRRLTSRPHQRKTVFLPSAGASRLRAAPAGKQLWWEREDSNLPDLAVTSTSSWRVYQLRHAPLVPKIRIELIPLSGRVFEIPASANSATRAATCQDFRIRCLLQRFGAGERDRTSLTFRSPVPETGASTNSATPAHKTLEGEVGLEPTTLGLRIPRSTC